MKYFNTFKRWAVIIKLVEEAEKKESRVGHTFIQKLIYLLQELFEIPLGYTFYIYYYGPYSDEVWGDLTAMQDTGFLTITADPSGYGYRIKTMNGEKKKWIKNKVKDLPEDRIEELVELLRDQPVRILELIATAHFIYKDLEKKNRFSENTLISDLRALKPHFSEKEVKDAFRIMKGIEKRKNEQSSILI